MMSWNLVEAGVFVGILGIVTQVLEHVSESKTIQDTYEHNTWTAVVRQVEEEGVLTDRREIVFRVSRNTSLDEIEAILARWGLGFRYLEAEEVPVRYLLVAVPMR